MNHLITGAELAIKNGMEFDSSCFTQAQKRDNNVFRCKMQEVLRHYQRGGQMKDRP